MKGMYRLSKALLVLVLTAVMISPVCLQAAAAQPDADQSIYVGGVAVTGENQDDIFGDGKASYSPEKKTLTFEGLELEGQDACIAAAGQDLILEGKAAFDCTGDRTPAISVSGGSLTVKGDITAKAKQGEAVAVDGGDLILEGSLTAVSRVNLKDSNDDGDPAAVTGNGILTAGDVIIKGSLNAQGSEAGLKAGKDVALSGGEVRAAGAIDGIAADGKISVSAGAVTVSGRNHGLWGRTVSVSDGIDSVVASGDWSVYGTDGITLDPKVKIASPEGGKLNDEGTNIIGPDGFFAPRVELNVSDGEDVPETETEIAPETETETGTETETESETVPVTETETEAPETETKAPETETEAPETETKAPETETETKAPETETKAPETETETKAPETETKAPETETEKASETETETAPVARCDISIQCVSGNAVVPGGSYELLVGKEIYDKWKGTGKVHVVKGLPEGTFTLRQSETPNGCLTAADQTITVDKNGKASYSGRTKNGVFLVENALTRVRILSVDEEGHPASGALLQVVSGKQVASEWKSDQAAKEVVGLNIDTTYTLKETEAPKWCKKTADTTFKIAGDGTISYSGEKDKDGNLLLKHKKSVTYYCIFFETGGGTAVKPQQVESGKMASKPDDPTRTDYTFDGWYKDPDLKNAYDFKTPVTADLTLYAKWSGGPAKNETGKETDQQTDPSQVSYNIISGAGSVYKKGSKDAVAIVIRRNVDDDKGFDHLESVKIDETLLKPETEYFVSKDKSEISLQPEALNQFEPGMRTLTVKFDDGQVQTQIHIRAQADGKGGSDDAGTGIKGIGKMIAGAIVLVIIAAAAAVGIYIKGGKMKR